MTKKFFFFQLQGNGRDFQWHFAKWQGKCELGYTAEADTNSS